MTIDRHFRLYGFCDQALLFYLFKLALVMRTTPSQSTCPSCVVGHYAEFFAYPKRRNTMLGMHGSLFKKIIGRDASIALCLGLLQFLNAATRFAVHHFVADSMTLFAVER